MRMRGFLITKKTAFVLAVLLILGASVLGAQEDFFQAQEQPQEVSEPEIIVDTGQPLFVIAAFEFDITGRTRPDALIRAGEFRIGEELNGEENLRAFIRDRTQLLINQRVLQETIVITYRIGERQADGAYPVTLEIMVEDSWNFIILPIPRYSTNTGLEVILRIRDYNFLGTMNPLSIDLGYHFDENQRHSFNFGLESNTPFNAFGLHWNFRFAALFSYRPDTDEPFHFRNVTGLSVEVPLRTTTFTFGFEESFHLNEENLNRHIPNYGEFQSGFFMSSRMFAEWEIPTGLHVSRFGELTYTPEVSATFNHEFSRWPLQDIRRGPFLDFGHTLWFERIDWRGNFREGISFSVSNMYRYDFFRQRNNRDPLSISYTVSGIGHLAVSRFFGISSRLMYRHWFYHDPAYNDMAADAIRGITDTSLSANYMLSLNLNFPLRLPLFSPARWFNNERLRALDIEFHLSPLLDLALYNDPQNGTTFDIDNLIAGGGLELMVFPLAMRNLYIRLSFAWNLGEVRTRPFRLPGGYDREITIMMGHFF